MTSPVESFLAGIALGVAVSVSPGPNTVMCVKLAAGGVRRAVPVITAAALTDAAYSLLAASGFLIASKASAHVVAYGTPLVLLAAAALALPSVHATTRMGAVVPLLNPATAALWLGLSSLPALGAPSTTAVLLRPLPVALGTALWFTALAFAVATARVKLDVGRGLLLQNGLAVLLAGLSALSLLRLA